MTRESLVMAIRGDEAEPVIVSVGEHDATIVLDDGARLIFDLTELRGAVAAPAPRRLSRGRLRRPDAAGGSDLEARR